MGFERYLTKITIIEKVDARLSSSGIVRIGRFIFRINTYPQLLENFKIQGTHWAVPAGGFILTFNHDASQFTTYMKINPSPDEIDLFERVATNMIFLGYEEEQRIICEGKNSVDEIAIDVLGWSQNDIAKSKRFSKDKFGE